MKDITIGQGETIRQTITVDEEGAATAQFIATDGTNGITGDTIAFEGLVANVTTTETVIPPGSYDFYYKIVWDDGSVDYLPDLSNCEGDCTFPQLIVCEVPGVS